MPIRVFSLTVFLHSLAVWIFLSATPSASASDNFPIPVELEPDVNFWLKVYTQVDTNSGYIHDAYNLNMVYETLRLSGQRRADEKKINYTSYQELSQMPDIYNLVEEQIRQANKDLPETARVVKFINLYKEFDADDDELTRTGKLRRAFVEQRYSEIVDALYSNNDNVHIDTTIKYEDGREAHIKTDLHIRKVKE